MDITFWSGSRQLVGAAVAALVIYVVALAAVRLAGRRTLAQMSAFDIVVTIAIGTLISSTALPSRASVLDGAAVLLTLLLMQVVLAAARQRFPALRRLLDFAPQVVVRDGAARLPRRPDSAQLTVSDLESWLRRKGVGGLDEVALAVLEPTGEVSVLRVGAPGRAPLFDRHDEAGSGSGNMTGGAR